MSACKEKLVALVFFLLLAYTAYYTLSLYNGYYAAEKRLFDAKKLNYTQSRINFEAKDCDKPHIVYANDIGADCQRWYTAYNDKSEDDLRAEAADRNYANYNYISAETMAVTGLIFCVLWLSLLLMAVGKLVITSKEHQRESFRLPSLGRKTKEH